MRRGPAAGRGHSLVEGLVVLALIGLAIAWAGPRVKEMRSRGRTAAAARLLALEFQHTRWESVKLSRSRGLWFERDGSRWTWRRVEDGDGDGLRSADLRSGRDRVLSDAVAIGDRVASVRLGFPPGGPFPRIPPERGVIRDLDDPVKFGRSDVVSFSRLGRSSSGTLYLTDGRESLFAVVLFGPSTRVRIWRFDPRARQWRR